MLIILKIQVNSPLKKTFLLCANNCKLLAKIASFREINKALLRIKIGISIISRISSIYILIKNL
jgi:hypothetical protein